MAGLGIGIAWFGYWVTYYGITQVQSGNWGFLDLGIPGRWTAAVAATPKDGPGASPAGVNVSGAGPAAGNAGGNGTSNKPDTGTAAGNASGQYYAGGSSLP